MPPRDRIRASCLPAAILALGTALIAPAAASAKTIVQISGRLSPAIVAFTTTPQSLSLTVDVRFSSDVPGGDPGTIRKSVILFPHGARVNSRLFPACSPRRLERLRGSRRACPRGSRIGSGSALGTSPQMHGVDEPLKIDVYNGPRGRSVIFFLHGSNPVSISGMIVAPLQTLHNHKWAYRLTLNVPHDLQEIATGIFASLLRFTTKVGGTVHVREHGRLVRHGYIEALACPPDTLVPIHGDFGFLDGSSTATDGYLTCH
jgi:hypothetical protein